jgi:hypothetical protein
MSTTFGGYRFQYNQGVDFQRYPAPASLAISVGDLSYWDGTYARPLSSYSIGSLTQTQTQAAIAAGLFVGVAVSGRITSQTGTTWPIDVVDVLANTPYLADCSSGTWNVGDLVGPVFNTGNTALMDQMVVKVANKALAIGSVIRYEPTAVTQCLIQLFGKGTGSGNPNTLGPGVRQGASATTLSDAAHTLDQSATYYLNMAPTAARTITLPLEAESAGLEFKFTNNSGGANSVTFDGSAGSAIKGNSVCPQNKTAIVWCDGTNWNGCVSA